MPEKIDLDYTYIFNAVSNGMSISDFDYGRIIDVNDAWINATGITREAAAGKAAFELGLWANQSEREKCLSQLHQNGIVVDFEAHLLTRGVEKLYLLQAKSVYIQDQHCVLWELQDITARKRMEQELLSANKLLNTIINTVPLRIFWKDRESNYLGCNALFAADAGLQTPDEITGKTDSQLAWRAEAELYRADDRDVMDLGIAKLAYEECQTTPAGNNIWLRTSKLPLRDVDKQVIGILGVYEDISARKQTELSLLTSEARYRSILESAPIGIVSISLSGYFLLVNQAFCNMLGYSREELEKLTYLDIIHPEDKSLARSERQLLIEGEIETYRKEKRYVRKDGSVIWVSITSSLERNQFGVPANFIAQVEDITAQKQNIALLLESRRVLNETQKIAGLGSFCLDIQSGLWQSSEMLDQIFGIDASYPHSVAGWEALLHADDRLRMSDYLRNEILGQGIRFDNEYNIIRQSDLAVRRVHGLAKLEFDDQGHPVTMLGTIQDITEKNKIETDLRIAATAFHTQEGILVTDADRLILKVNKAFTDISGYSSEEVLGKTPGIFRSGRHDASFYSAMWKMINSSGSWNGEIWNRRKNGEIYPEYLTITAVQGSDGIISNYVATLQDVTLSKAAENEIRNLAFFDSLTQLPNRRLLQDRLSRSLAAGERSGKPGALLFIGLDNFKKINDSLGHGIGDLLLQAVAGRLKSCVREGDTAARFGGDEFVILLEELNKDLLEAATEAESIGRKILAALQQPYLIGQRELYCTTSIGITLFKGHQFEPDDIFRQADIAMSHAKDAGRNALRFFDPKMQEAIDARSALEVELRKALELGQFELYYQIQMDYLQHPIGAEALIRWIHPERGMVSPSDFIPIAEDTGLIISIGQWVLEAACLQLKKWQQNALTRDLLLSVNVSAKQFRQADFVAKVQATLQFYAINATHLKLELTESLLLQDVVDVIAKMQAISKFGVRFSLDDFGTGYSSLQYLKRLPLHQLKIDQSFVRELAINHSDRAIVDTIISMARSLNLEVIAEGVETETQRRYLENAGCPNYQGYLFSKPVPFNEFELLVKKFHEKSPLYLPSAK